MQPGEGALPEMHVQPGECRLVSRPSVLHTVLGSCVGITFLVPRLGIGALCHPMLPLCSASRSVGMPDAARRRYVDFAIREMARRLESLGAERNEMRVKLFGGCDVLPVESSSARPTVGKLNADTALRVLAEEGLVASATRLGGDSGINISFRTDTGEVLLRDLAGGKQGRGRSKAKTTP
jgi:chemotaxis protein CheD